MHTCVCSGIFDSMRRNDPSPSLTILLQAADARPVSCMLLLIQDQPRSSHTLIGFETPPHQTHLSLRVSVMTPLECPVCMNQYNVESEQRPMSLSCGHTVCRGCISRMPTQTCPTCRTPFIGQLCVQNFALCDVLAEAASEVGGGAFPRRLASRFML